MKKNIIIVRGGGDIAIARGPHMTNQRLGKSVFFHGLYQTVQPDSTQHGGHKHQRGG